jgi:hypothetical protein
MAGWTYGARKWRAKIINDYLKASGAKAFDPEEFAAWVRQRPDHPLYDVMQVAAR